MSQSPSIYDNTRRRRISSAALDAALLAVEGETGVTRAEIEERQRTKRVARARQLVMYRLRSVTRDGLPLYSFLEIGRVLGLDHSTAFFAVRQVKKRLSQSRASRIGEGVDE